MKIGDKITLADGKEFGLLLDSVMDDSRYFLGVLLDSKEEPTDKFQVFKEIVKDNKFYVITEKNPLILNTLLEDYNLQLEDID